MNTWKTCDLPTIQFLLYHGHEVLEPKMEGARVFLIFKDNGSLAKAVKEFRSRKASVEPMLYNECRRRALNIIENAKMEQRGH